MCSNCVLGRRTVGSLAMPFTVRFQGYRLRSKARSRASSSSFFSFNVLNSAA